MNPNAIVVWLLFGCIGWLIGGITGAVAGIAIALFISLCFSS